MTILVDMDDVLEKLVASWVDFLNKKYSTNVKPEDVDDWDISKFFPTLTREQVFQASVEEDMWKNVKPMPGAEKALKKLIADGHELYIVTATLYPTVKVKMEDVLFKYYDFLSWDQVIITSKKQLIKGDVLIDDGPHNLEGGSYHKILFTAAHNKKFDEKTIGAIRVNNWDEALSVIDSLNVNKNQTC